MGPDVRSRTARSGSPRLHHDRRAARHDERGDTRNKCRRRAIDELTNGIGHIVPELAVRVLRDRVGAAGTGDVDLPVTDGVDDVGPQPNPLAALLVSTGWVGVCLTG